MYHPRVYLWGGLPSRYTHPPRKGPRTRHTHTSTRRDLGPGIPLLDRMTHTCENITFPQFRWRVVIIRNIITARKHSLRRLCFYTCLSVILFTDGGGVRGRGWHAWQGACMVGGGMCGSGGCVAGGVCMAGGHAWWGGVRGRYYGQ